MINEQHDTTTLAGKISVMSAAIAGKKIQYCRKRSDLYKDWQDIQIERCIWDWPGSDYRIRPHELDLPRFHPWNTNEVPVGKTVRRKFNDDRFLITGSFGRMISLGSKDYTAVDLLKLFVMEDGSPCGVTISL